uniref:MULE transposase domain-containing protein n=1 Tax=Oryza brachyantha TaxID=4533 RepID=J3MK21_ORYBR
MAVVMDRVVRVYSGGTVSSDGKFDAMKVDMLVFTTSPTWVELRGRICSRVEQVGCADVLRMEEWYDVGIGSKEHYVMMPISREMEWSTYVACVSSSQLRVLDVVVRTCGGHRNMSDPLTVVCGSSVDIGHEPMVERAVIVTEQLVENLTQEVTLLENTTHHPLVEKTLTLEAPIPEIGTQLSPLAFVAIHVEGGEGDIDDCSSLSSSDDEGLTPFYGKKELEKVKKGKDYAVRHHRPYVVTSSDLNKRYTIQCQRAYQLKVWARKTCEATWRITNVDQPHTYGTSKPSGEHSQATATYLARRITGVLLIVSDTSVPTLIEVIFVSTQYRVKFGKAWRAKQKAIELIWGDWKEAYGRVPRKLNTISHFNPSTKYFIHHGNHKEMAGTFPACIEAFKHCRPIVVVDDTFITGKYKGTLLTAITVNGNDQLVPIVFALVEGENNDSWSWFVSILWLEVLGNSCQVCIVSDRHMGIINAVNKKLDGFPDIIHQWCVRHFTGNLWKKHKCKDVIGWRIKVPAAEDAL